METEAIDRPYRTMRAWGWVLLAVSALSMVNYLVGEAQYTADEQGAALIDFVVGVGFTWAPLMGLAYVVRFCYRQTVVRVRGR